MFGISVRQMGPLRISLTASSQFDDLAQMTVSVFVDNAFFTACTFQGSKGADVTISREGDFFGYNHYIKLYFAQSGLKLKCMTIDYV